MCVVVCGFACNPYPAISFYPLFRQSTSPLVLHNYYQKRKYIKEQMKRKKIGCAYLYPSLIIDSYLGDWSGRPLRPKQRVGSDRPWHKESHDMRDSVWDGLWRPGGAFFQIGLGCVMSHHQSPHRRALHIPVLILAGKFKMEFLPTVSLT